MIKKFQKKFITVVLACVIAMFSTLTIINATQLTAQASTSDWAFEKLENFGFSEFKLEPFSKGKTVYFTVYPYDGLDESYCAISGSGNKYKISLMDSNGKYKQIYPKWRMAKEYGISNPIKYGSLKISGNTIKYRKINNDYQPYGKWYSAKLASSTVYLKGDFNSPCASMLSYFDNSDGSLDLRRVPYFKKKNKSNFVKYIKNSYGWSQCGINIKNGKVKAICYDSAAIVG